MPEAIHARHVGCNCTQEGVLEQSKLAQCLRHHAPALKQAKWVQIKLLMISCYRKDAQIQQALLVV
jgi:hypothetical protein